MFIRHDRRIGPGVEDRETGNRILDNPGLELTFALSSRRYRHQDALTLKLKLDRLSGPVSDFPQERSRNHNRLYFLGDFASHSEAILLE